MAHGGSDSAVGPFGICLLLIKVMREDNMIHHHLNLHLVSVVKLYFSPAKNVRLLLQPILQTHY